MAAITPDIDALVDAALAEDIGTGDITTEAVYRGIGTGDADIVAKQDGVIAGLALAAHLYAKADAGIRVKGAFQDGDAVRKGDLVMSVRGPADVLLRTERTVLNFMQRMSGVATRTRAFVDAVAHTGVRILDTRKTLPGHRTLDKWAVRLGGGTNHRVGLFDMYLVKENHIAVVGGLTAAVGACVAHRAARGTRARIEVEAATIADVAEALAIPEVDVILLDNMTLPMMREAVDRVAGRKQTEASGNVSLRTVAAIAETGVDFISVGSLTHSAQALDLSMLFR
jgi:nicotinate-nucleotide pyrophosphorylase (carboxylating)